MLFIAFSANIAAILRIKSGRQAVHLLSGLGLVLYTCPALTLNRPEKDRLKMPSLNKSQKYLIAHIKKYENIITKISNGITDYRLHFGNPYIIKKAEKNWLTFEFYPLLESNIDIFLSPEQANYFKEIIKDAHTVLAKLSNKYNYTPYRCYSLASQDIKKLADASVVSEKIIQSFKKQPSLMANIQKREELEEKLINSGYSELEIAKLSSYAEIDAAIESPQTKERQEEMDNSELLIQLAEKLRAIYEPYVDVIGQDFESWEDVFDKCGTALKQCLREVEDAISLISNVQYEKNKELLLCLIQVRNKMTEAFQEAKSNRAFNPKNLGFENEIESAIEIIDDILGRIDEPKLTKFADELEAIGRIERANQQTAEELNSGDSRKNKNLKKPDIPQDIVKTQATKTPKPVVVLDGKDRKILSALEKYNQLVNQVDLESDSSIGLSRKTIGKRLLLLHKADYICYPKGENGGISITNLGKEVLKPQKTS